MAVAAHAYETGKRVDYSEWLIVSAAFRVTFL